MNAGFPGRRCIVVRGSEHTSADRVLWRADFGLQPGRSALECGATCRLCPIACPIDPGRRVRGAGRRQVDSRSGWSREASARRTDRLVTWTPEIGLVAVDFNGVIRGTDDPMGNWDEVGRVDGSPAAIENMGDELLVATHEARVLSSRDGGSKLERDSAPVTRNDFAVVHQALRRQNGSTGSSNRSHDKARAECHRRRACT